MDIIKLLKGMVKLKASDLHLQAGTPPAVRINGVMDQIKAPALKADDTRQAAFKLTPPKLKPLLERGETIDFSYTINGVSHYRASIFWERGNIGLVFRAIPLQIPSFGELNLPTVLADIADQERGLVLVTGTTGCGKSTTLAAMLDRINETRKNKIVTIEDPIEYFHTNKKSMVAQMEVGVDTPSFDEAMRRVLRHDPDVILVGEMRDMNTMRVALRAADTGHLVFTTVHTTNASQTVQRLIAMFPRNEHDLLLTQLASNLESVISQRLAVTADGKGRVPAVEILRNTPIVKKLILEQRLTTLPQIISNREGGMQLFDQHLVDLHRAKRISGTEAMRLASNAEALSLALRGVTSIDMGASIVTG